MNRKVGLCIQLNKGKGFVVYNGINQAGLVNVSRNSLYMGAVLRPKISGNGGWGGGSYSGYILRILPMLAFRPEEGFTISLSLVQGALCHFFMSLRLGSWTQLCPCQQSTFTQEFTYSGLLPFLQQFDNKIINRKVFFLHPLMPSQAYKKMSHCYLENGTETRLRGNNLGQVFLMFLVRR